MRRIIRSVEMEAKESFKFPRKHQLSSLLSEAITAIDELGLGVVIKVNSTLDEKYHYVSVDARYENGVV